MFIWKTHSHASKFTPLLLNTETLCLPLSVKTLHTINHQLGKKFGLYWIPSHFIENSSLIHCSYSISTQNIFWLLGFHLVIIYVAWWSFMHLKHLLTLKIKGWSFGSHLCSLRSCWKLHFYTLTRWNMEPLCCRVYVVTGHVSNLELENMTV